MERDEDKNAEEEDGDGDDDAISTDDPQEPEDDEPPPLPPPLAAPAPAEPPLRIYESGRWRFRTRDTDVQIGRLNPLGMISIKATCQRHGGGCVCSISLPAPGSARHLAMGRDVTMRDIERDLVRWLDMGLDSTAIGHDADARRLRKDTYFMKVA